MSPTRRPAKALGLCEHGGEARGARALRHGLLQGQIGVDRALEMRLVDQDDVGDVRRARSATVSLPTFFTAMPSASVGAAAGCLSPCSAFHIDG